MSREKSAVKDFSQPLYLALGRLLWVRRALASALTCLILALVILIPLFSLLTIIASQALEFSSTVSRGLQTGHPSSGYPPRTAGSKTNF